MKKENLRKVLFLLMTFVMLVPYILQPTIVLAEVWKEQTIDSMSLDSFKVDKEKQTEAELIATVQKSQEGESVIRLRSTLPLAKATLKEPVSDVVVSKDEQGIVLTTSKPLNSQVKIQVEAANGPVTTNDNWTIQADSGQHLSADIPVADRLPEDTGSQEVVEETETKGTDSLENTKATADSAPVEETAKDGKDKPAPLTSKMGQQPRTEKGLNIKDLLSKEGLKTIIKKFSLTIKNEDGTEQQVDMGNTVPVKIKKGDTVKLSVEWALPESVAKQMKEGDYYEFELPSIFGLYEGNIELKNKEGKVFAIAKSSKKDGKNVVRFTFTDIVKVLGHIDGTYNYEQKIENVSKPGRTEVTFPHEEGLGSIILDVESTIEHNITKEGSLNKPLDATEIEWTIDLNLKSETVKNPRLVDTLPDGLLFNEEDVVVYPADVDLDGKITTGTTPLDKATYTVTYNKETREITVTFREKMETPHRVKIKTRIDSEKVYNPDELKDSKTIDPRTGKIAVEYKNHANFKDGETSIGSTGASVAGMFYSNMVKTGPIEAEGGGQNYNWTVKANYHQKNLPVGTLISDKFLANETGHNMSLVKESLVIQKVSFETATNNEVFGAKLVEGDDYELIDNGQGGFDVKLLKATNSALYLMYQTHVEELIEDDEQPVLSNEVTIGEESVGSEGGVRPQGLKKYPGQVDYNKRENPWVIIANSAKRDMTEWSITDTLPDGLTLIQESIVVSVNQNGSRTKLVLDQDYTIDFKGQTFIITPKDTWKKTNKEIVVQFNTKFDTQGLDTGHDDTGNGDEITFVNTAVHHWKDSDGKDQQTEAEGSVTLVDIFQDNGKKFVTYDPTTKKMTWNVVVNVNQHTLKDASIVDPIVGNHTYVSGSAKLYKVNLQDELKPHEMEPVEKLIDLDSKEDVSNVSMTEPSADNNQTLTVGLPEDSKEVYLLSYETTHEGQLVSKEPSYTNKATFTNQEIKHILTASVSPKYAGETLNKEGKLSGDEQSIAWSLAINRSLSRLENVVVTDEPSVNQIILKEGIHLFGTTILTDGDIVKNEEVELAQGKDYTVALTEKEGKQILTVSFMKTINEAYILEYTGIVNNISGKDRFTVSNKASLKADKVETMDTESSGAIEVTDMSGSASGKTGKLTVYKQDSDKKPLVGAEFELWKIDSSTKEKTVKLKSGVTDKDGHLDFGALRPNEYLLIETKAPTGYVIHSDYREGKLVTLDAIEPEEEGTLVTVENKRYALELKKTDDTVEAKPLAGAKFSLLDESEKVLLSGLTTDEDGILTVTSSEEFTNGEILAPGKTYYFKETEAPAGYIKNTELLQVELNEQGEQVVHMPQFINYQGSIEWIKLDEEGNPLQGATFDIRDKQGKKVIQTGLVSDKDGKVTASGLAPGQYTIKETKARDGYILNAELIPFTINEKAKGQPIVEALTITNYQGDVEIEKVNESGDLLDGALFDVRDEKGKEAIGEEYANLVAEGGKLSIKGLAPGNYTLVETQAPKGYIRNTEKLTFTIEPVQNGKPNVISLSMINYKGSIELTKLDEKGDPLEGVTFDIRDKQGKKVIQTGLVSDKHGKIIAKDLEPGQYTIKEVKTRDGYILNTELIPFTISEKAKGQPIVETLTMTNYQGSIEITKVGPNKELLSGATFDIRDKQGKKVIQTGLVSDEDGKVTATGLAPGEYTVVETKAPKGYILNSKQPHFVVDETYTGQPSVISVSLTNYQGSVEITKVGPDGELLSGAAFDIRDKQGEKVIQTGLVSDKDGKVTATGLAPGNYTLVETQAPKGYIRNTEKLTFTIEPVQNGKPNVISLSMINYKGSIELTKLDEKGDPLEDVAFDIRDKQGKKVIQTGLISDKHGKIIAKDLEPGQYTIKEVKTRDGYILNTELIPFTISEKAKGQPIVETFTMTNYKGSVQWRKINNLDTPLKGAAFDILTTDGTKINDEPLTSDENGLVSYVGLAPGDYVVQETKAPEKHELSKEEITFTIPEYFEGKVTSIDLGDVVNTLIPVIDEKPGEPGEPGESDKSGESGKPDKSGKPDEPADGKESSKGILPQTGESTGRQLVFVLVGLIVIGMVSIIVYRRKVRK